MAGLETLGKTYLHMYNLPDKHLLISITYNMLCRIITYRRFWYKHKFAKNLAWHNFGMFPGTYDSYFLGWPIHFVCLQTPVTMATMQLLWHLFVAIQWEVITCIM